MLPDKSRQIIFDHVFRDLMLEASEEELKDLLEDADEDFETLSKIGEEVVKKAISEYEYSTNINDLHRSLGTLINMLRRRDKITVSQLANKANIDPTELYNIETDPNFKPNPRTIIQLEKYFNLVPRTLVILSGAVRVKKEVHNEAVRFAAKAQNVSDLSKDELKLLNNFVKILKEYTD